MSRVCDVDVAFAEWVRRERLGRGLSQAVLARAAGIPRQQTFAKIELGQRPATVGEGCRLAAVLGGSFPDLVSGLAPVCVACFGQPPANFTCNACGAVAS